MSTSQPELSIVTNETKQIVTKRKPTKAERRQKKRFQRRGALYTWGGKNGNGALGHGNKDAVTSPKLVAALLEPGKRVANVSFSFYFAAAVLGRKTQRVFSAL